VQCSECGYRHFKCLGSVNTAQGCTHSHQHVFNWALKSGLLDEHRLCIIRRKRCNRCGTVMRTVEYKVATERRRRRTKFGGKLVSIHPEKEEQGQQES